MHEKEIVEFMKTSKLFSSLNDEAYVDIARYFKPLQILANEILFHQGDAPDYLYILIKGHLLAILQLENKDLKVIGEIEKGEVLGELGVISNQPRTTTIKATTTSYLLKVTSEDFAKICEKYPTIFANVIRPVITRSQKNLQILSQKKMKRHVAIIPASNQVSMQEFKKNIVKNLPSVPDITLFMEKDSLSRSSYQSQVNNLEEKYRTILFFLEDHSALLKTSLAKIDIFYIVAEEGQEIDYTVINQIKKHNEWLKNIDEVLVILKHKHNLSANVSNSLLSSRNYSFFHNVRINQDQDYQRLLRFMNGTPIGLVLGGGALRGYIHLGVLKALQEANIPIDMVGGTSIGSMVAGCFAVTENAKKSLKIFQEILSGNNILDIFTNLTWPFVSLLSAKRGTENLIKIFGKTKIENLYIPYFCMTANVNLRKEFVHRSGYLWEKIRGSCSIPMLVPPVVIDGQIHVDGGLLNDLPVDVMRKYLGPNSKIIAISIYVEKEDTRSYNFPPILTFKQTMGSLLGICNQNFQFPSFLDLYFKCMQLGASAQELKNAESADLFISPDLTRYHFLSLRKGQENELINIGYQEMKKQLNIQKAFKQSK